MAAWVPDRGDIVWLASDPQQGREIQKRRPALTISPKKYNAKTGLGLFMPVTSQVKGYPFETPVDLEGVKGCILCDQMRSLDWRARNAALITALPADMMTEVMSKFMLLVR